MTKKAVPGPMHGDKPLDFHPLADIFPLMEGDEFAALVADVREHGVRERITLYEDRILDGRNRYRAWQECRDEGHTCDWRIFRPISDDPAERHAEATAFVISANIHRRHLNGEQKRDLIAKLLKATPQKSDRAIAKVAKVDDKTVAAVRADKEATAEIPQLEKRTGADGKTRKQPTRRTATRSEAKKAKRAVESGMPRLMADLDRVKAILVERIGLEGLTLVWAAMMVSEGALCLNDTINVPGYGAEVFAKVMAGDYTFEDFFAKYSGNVGEAKRALEIENTGLRSEVEELQKLPGKTLVEILNAALAALYKKIDAGDGSRRSNLDKATAAAWSAVYQLLELLTPPDAAKDPEVMPAEADDAFYIPPMLLRAR